MPNKQLTAAIKKLLSKDRKLIRMKDLRLLVKGNEELSDIKLSGKGRTKGAIVKDLESRITQKKKVKKRRLKYNFLDDVEYGEFDGSDFVVNPTGTYCINDLTATDWCIASFIEREEDKYYAKKLNEEYEKKDFSSWEDVEKRCVGFQKEMIKHFDTIYWSFGPNHLKGVTYCTFDHDLKRFECPIVSERELNETIKKHADNHSIFNEIDHWEEEDDDEEDGLCLSWAKAEQKMQHDPRKPQNVPNRNGNIVMIASFDTKSGTFCHGSGCMIDEKHVLTCAHLFVKGRAKYNNNLIWSVRSHNGSHVGIVSTVILPKLWPPKNDLCSTKSSSDVAVLSLVDPIVSKFPYPVFGLSLKKYEHPKKGSYLAIDGYPGQVKREPANGWNQKRKQLLCNLVGDFGKVTKSGLDSKSLQSLAFITPGTSGAPAMLCDGKGDYLTNGDSPIVVGIAVNLGLKRTGDSTVCVPMKPWTLAFISNAIGYKVNLQSEYVRKQMVSYMNKYKTQTNEYSRADVKIDEDVKMK